MVSADIGRLNKSVATGNCSEWTGIHGETATDGVDLKNERFQCQIGKWTVCERIIVADIGRFEHGFCFNFKKSEFATEYVPPLS